MLLLEEGAEGVWRGPRGRRGRRGRKERRARWRLTCTPRRSSSQASCDLDRSETELATCRCTPSVRRCRLSAPAPMPPRAVVRPVLSAAPAPPPAPPPPAPPPPPAAPPTAATARRGEARRGEARRDEACAAVRRGELTPRGVGALQEEGGAAAPPGSRGLGRPLGALRGDAPREAARGDATDAERLSSGGGGAHGEGS